MIERESPIPMYQQLASIIRDKILKGELKSGSKISSVNELVKLYGVSRVTVVQAIEELVKSGLIISRQGKGSYVRTSKHIEDLSSLRSFEEITNLESNNVVQKILSYNFIPLSKQLAEIFPSTQKVLKIERVHIEENIPIAKVNIFLPEEAAYHISKEKVKNHSLYEIFEKNDIQISVAIQKIEAQPASGSLLEDLQVENGFPLLFVQRTSIDNNKNIIMFSEFFYRYDAYTFMAKLQRTSDL
ncbi:GntR family transcriptional regulator [Bacillus subtilis]|uniref:HTH gntR-type domain-containing protein n=1 Tax=Bacillus subtilis subsp. subtilis TaxID=135461 RepID=A0ABD3ZX57_BACIU|nr:GntR family transcriptional regulator [Bacillus subtilis]KIL32858.1 hypothetical protein B4067_4711 [Bacillus subtilis subsp. subtilis]KIN57455.1 hypothetical protein B4145_4587 [Bacillus subtilis]